MQVRRYHVSEMLCRACCGCLSKTGEALAISAGSHRRLLAAASTLTLRNAY